MAEVKRKIENTNAPLERRVGETVLAKYPPRSIPRGFTLGDRSVVLCEIDV